MANYTYGSGKIFFDLFAAGTTNKTGERYIGNSPAFKINVATQSLEHFDVDNGYASKDASVLTQITRKGSFETDEISIENMGLFVIGSSSTQTQTSGAVTAEAVTSSGVAERWYQLGATNTNPAGVRSVTGVALKTGGTTYVAGTDYEVDVALARFRIITGSAMVGAAITADYTKSATTRLQVASAALATLDGAMRFISNNPTGKNRDIYIPRCRVTPNGDFDVKGNTWQKLTFDLEIDQLNSTTAAIYIDGRPGDLT